MRITALVENTSARPELIAEHALSLYIESNGYKILFDMVSAGGANWNILALL